MENTPRKIYQLSFIKILNDSAIRAVKMSAFVNEMKETIDDSLIPGIPRLIFEKYPEKLGINEKTAIVSIEPLTEPDERAKEKAKEFLPQIKIMKITERYPPEIPTRRTIPIAPVPVSPMPRLSPAIQPKKPMPRLPSYSDFKKLSALLSDPSVSYIECPGAGKNVLVSRYGQKQITKIQPNKEDIREFLESVAEKARVPMLEGVFRAAVDNFMVSAVVSDMIGSRFIIKKQAMI